MDTNEHESEGLAQKLGLARKVKRGKTVFIRTTMLKDRAFPTRFLTTDDTDDTDSESDISVFIRVIRGQTLLVAAPPRWVHWCLFVVSGS
jgi:hypothetical protein